MGQYWELFNIDKRQKGQGVEGKFPEFLFQNHDWLVKLLARPELPEVSLPPYYLSISTNNKNELGSFSDTPPEVIATVLSHIPSVDDVTCFAVAHHLLMPEGLRRLSLLRRAEFAHCGSWAGDRIITAGDYLDDPPEGMLTSAEENEIGEASEFYEFASSNYKLNPPLSRHPQMTRNAWLFGTGKKNGIKTALQRVARGTGDYHRVRLFLESTAPQYAPNATWALCNITKKKYARANALASMKIPGEDVQFRCTVEGPFVKSPMTAIGLGTLAIIVTADSSDMGDVGVYGRWAGDRLMVSTVEGLPEGWEDASAATVKVVKGCVMSNDDMF